MRSTPNDASSARRARRALRALRALCALSALSALPALAQQPNTLSAEERSAGFKLLFDGVTVSDWRGYRQKTLPAGWTVTDGTLGLAAGSGAPASGDIVTRDEYASFELRLQWRIAKDGNSGIMYRVSEEYGAPYESGPEMQALDDAGHADGKSRLTAAGSCFGLYPAQAGIVKPAGEWNDVTLIVNDAYVEHWLNGVKVVQYELWSPEWRARVLASKFRQWPGYGMSKKGRIALQDHGDAVSYRSIRIRKL